MAVKRTTVTLGAGVVSTVELLNAQARDVEIVNLTVNAPIYFRVDGVDPASNGLTEEFVIPGVAGSGYQLRMPGRRGNNATVKLISTGAGTLNIGVIGTGQ